MRAGRQRHRVIVEQVTETQDSVNQPVKTWTTYVEMWGKVRPMRGRELFTAAQRWPEVDTVITLRGNPRTDLITEKMRASLTTRDRTKIFNILAVIDKDERGIQVDLICRREGIV